MTTMIKIRLAALVLLLAISCKKESSTGQSSSLADNDLTSAGIADIDAPAKIASVTIGSQVWMKRNLNVSRYRNGDPIPQVRNTAKWGTLTTGAWCWYNNDSVRGRTYGRLYNWYAVNDPRGLAPAGWHIPSDSEWTTLSNFLGGIEVAGGKMKTTGTIEAGTGLWYAPNTDATNSSGFTGLPGGFRLDNGAFYGFGHRGLWWTSTGGSPYGPYFAWLRRLWWDSSGLIVKWDGERDGLSVRCIKD